MNEQEHRARAAAFLLAACEAMERDGLETSEVYAQLFEMLLELEAPDLDAVVH